MWEQSASFPAAATKNHKSMEQRKEGAKDIDHESSQNTSSPQTKEQVTPTKDQM